MTTPTIAIHGGWGTLTVCSTTGDVTAYNPGGDFDESDPDPSQGYLKIARIDLVEWRGFLVNQGLTDTGDTDILNVGYWLKDGEYEEPAHDYRAIWLPDALEGRPGGALIANEAVGQLLGVEPPSIDTPETEQ